MKAAAYLAVVFVIPVWGMTFANTRALLEDFRRLKSSFCGSLWHGRCCGCGKWFRGSCGALGERAGAGDGGAGDGVRHKPAVGGQFRDELLFAGMGVTGVAAYQFLENCAIYYTNASNVAILVSFGPIVTAVMARLMTKDRTLSVPFMAGSLVAVCGVAMVGLNGVVNFNVRPLGDLMALGALASAACFVLWSRACKTLGMVRTTVGLYLTLVIGIVFAMLFLGERLTIMGASGGIVIIAGVALTSVRSWRRSRK